MCKLSTIFIVLSNADYKLEKFARELNKVSLLSKDKLLEEFARETICKDFSKYAFKGGSFHYSNGVFFYKQKEKNYSFEVARINGSSRIEFTYDNLTRFETFKHITELRTILFNQILRKIKELHPKSTKEAQELLNLFKLKDCLKDFYKEYL